VVPGSIIVRVARDTDGAGRVSGPNAPCNLVVIAAGENPNLVRQHLVHQSMLLVDTPRPTASQLVPQRFRLTNTCKGIALRVSYKTDDTNRLSPVLFCPPCQIVERAGVEFDCSHKSNFATASSRDTPFSRSRAIRRRCRMVSDFSR